ncbi:MAG: YicC family protein [Christensenellaceae bacterium]|nr:YicC family protein [Christensenellaceae bacterium]
MKSMTGFGRAEAEEQGYKLTIEIKTVNHRFLDMNIRMPRFMLFLEDAARALIKEKLARGRVEVFINFAATRESNKKIRVDMGMVRSYLEAAKTIRSQVKVKDDVTLARLMTFNDVLSFEEEKKDEELLEKLLMDVLGQALDRLNEAREAEGHRIGADILARTDLLTQIVDEIEQREPVVAEEYREKLRAKLEEYLSDTEIDPNRFNAEMLYFTDRASITEEIVRLRSHFVQLKETLSSDAASGRSLDFLVQELNRECNTIGSKSSDVTITKAVLRAKSEVEKIREQVQNIE